jgi:hypothetical protein
MSTGLSTAAIAGISVGAALASLPQLVLFWRRSKNTNVSSPALSQEFYDTPNTHRSAGWGPKELNHEREPVEIGSTVLVREPVEMA